MWKSNHATNRATEISQSQHMLISIRSKDSESHILRTYKVLSRLSLIIAPRRL